MAFRRYVRRPRRVFRKRRGTTYRRPAYRRRYATRRPVRRRALARVQNFVKFTAKVYRPYALRWEVDTPESGSIGSAIKWKVPLVPALFMSQNAQFLRNLNDYHWVKFNYIAVKIHELSYVGFQTPASNEQVTIPLGVTSHQADKYPMYFCWDIEEAIGFGSGTAEVNIGPEALSQYQGTKKFTPTSKRPVTFVYRFPQPWRQFFGTYNVRALSNTKVWHAYMQDLSGVSNLRCPSVLLGTHANWWGNSLPNNDVSANLVTQIGVTYYLGVTFRGRKIMDSTVPASMPLADISEVDEDDD